MNFIAEATVVLLEIVSIMTLIFVCYLRFGRKDQRQQAIGNRHADEFGIWHWFSVGIFIAMVGITLFVSHAIFATSALWAGSLYLTIGLLTAAIFYFSFIRKLISDPSIHYAMMMWSATCLFIVSLLAALAWGAWRTNQLGNQFDGEMLVEFISPLAQTAGIIIAATMVVVTNRFSADQAKRTAGQAIYQNLEFASVELFRFEAEHPELVRALWFDEPKPLGDHPTKEEELARYALEQYVCQMLNMFEMELRFRREGIIPPDVFASWIVWFYEICCLPTFIELWKTELKPHYILDFQNLIDKGIEVAEKEIETRDVTGEPNWIRVQDFYEEVAKLVSPGKPCAQIRHWLGERGLLDDKKRKVKDPGLGVIPATPADQPTTAPVMPAGSVSF